MDINQWFEKMHAMTPAEKLATYKVTEVRFHRDCMVISWIGAAGFGQYTIDLERETEINPETGYEDTKSFSLHGDSEGMDLGNDKKIFLSYLFAQIVDMVDLSKEQEREDDWKRRQEEREKANDK